MKKEFYSSPSFPMVFSKIIGGDQLFRMPLEGIFNFHYNTRTKEGKAQLVYLNKTALALTLYPEFENNFLVFTSNMQPTTYTILGEPVVLHKVILKIALEDDIRSAAITFNQNGDVQYTTDAFSEIDNFTP